MITGLHRPTGSAFIGLDYKTPAELAKLSLGLIARMDANQGTLRGVVSFVKVVSTLKFADVEFVVKGTASMAIGCDVRLNAPPSNYRLLNP